MQRLLAVSTVFLLAVGLAACGDDDDEGELAAYCDAAAELDDQEGPPDEDQLEELRELAPEEIGDDVDFAAGRLIEAAEEGNLEEAFDDPEVVERIERIEEFEEENCPDQGGDE